MLSFSHLHIKYADLPEPWQPVYVAMMQRGFTFAATHLREVIKFSTPTSVLKGLGYGDGTLR